MLGLAVATAQLLGALGFILIGMGMFGVEFGYPEAAKDFAIAVS